MIELKDKSAEQIPKLKKERNYGVDFLRIIAMFMVVVLHVLGCGGVLGGTQAVSVNYTVAWFMEILALCAVNCYGIISGYVGYKSRFRLSSIIQLSITVFFYAFAITGIYALVFPGTVGFNDVVDSVACIWRGNGYWYFTAYFCAFFFFPYLNAMVEKLNKPQLKKLMATIIVIFCVIPTITDSNLFNTLDGYSALWLMVLYVIGAYIQKYDIGINKKPVSQFMMYLLFSIMSLGGMIALNWLTPKVFTSPKYTDAFIRYTSALMLFSAVSLFLTFRNLKPGKILKRIIAFFAPLAFSVYIIHTHRMFWVYILTNRFVSFASLNPFVLVFSVLAVALVICLFCSVADWFRCRIFELLRIKQICDKTEVVIRNLWHKFNRGDSNDG